MISENVKQIIEELCELDPELKKHEEKLEKIVIKFLEAKPDTKFDAEFARTLKTKILLESLPEKKSFSNSILSLFNMNNKYLVLSGATLAVVIIAVVTVQQNSLFQPARQLGGGAANIMRVAAGSFGALSTQAGGGASNQNVVATKNASAIPEVAFGRGGGGGGLAATMGVVSGSTGSGSADSAVAVSPPSAKMMIYRPYQIKYVYKGETVELKDKNLDVLRRIKPQLNTTGAVGALNKFSFGGLDLGSFSGNQVTSFELSQPDSQGYVTNVNLRDGSISISQNYNNNPCPNGVCPVYVPLRPSEMPSDEALISLGNSFLKDHGVNLANYGEPQVENDWRKTLESTEPGIAPYVPDSISVVYPQKINGTVVYDLGGGVNGLRINVDVRQKKVTGAWGIINQDYEASSYEAETDASKIIKIAEAGGIYGGGYGDPSAEIVEVELGTPKRVFVNVWKNDGSGEVVVPALYFPVIKSPKESQYYIQNALVVPLVKELLKMPEVGPIQLMRDSATPASLPEVKGL